jgi:hypothetical protein
VTTEHDSTTPNLADPESLLGMLQRGRGKGYLLALKAPPEDVWPLLFECITNDPRIDQECEWRQDYYASLIRATYMDLEPLRAHLKTADKEDGDTVLIWETLLALAKEGRDSHALSILHEYISYGRDWDYIMDVIADANWPEAVEGGAEALCERVLGDWSIRSEFTEAVRREWECYCSYNQAQRADCHLLLPICEPWKTICRTNERLAALFDEAGIDYDQPGPPGEPREKPSISGLSLEGLFSQVGNSNCSAFRHALPEKVSASDEDYLLGQLASGDDLRMSLAFIGLGVLGTPKALKAVRSWIEECDESVDPPLIRRWAFDAFCRMPGSLTLDVARRWFRSEGRWTRFMAVRVLANHATVEDIPLLREVLHMSEIASREDRRLSFALEAFTLFKGIGRVPEVESVFCCAGDSYDRYRAAEAMHATAPDHFVDQYAFECLWDCHWETRALGCTTADLSMPGVLSRLRELAADSHDEDTTVREAAQARLKK